MVPSLCACILDPAKVTRWSLDFLRRLATGFGARFLGTRPRHRGKPPFSSLPVSLAEYEFCRESPGFGRLPSSSVSVPAPDALLDMASAVPPSFLLPASACGRIEGLKCGAIETWRVMMPEAVSRRGDEARQTRQGARSYTETTRHPPLPYHDNPKPRKCSASPGTLILNRFHSVVDLSPWMTR